MCHEAAADRPDRNLRLADSADDGAQSRRIQVEAAIVLGVCIHPYTSGSVECLPESRASARPTVQRPLQQPPFWPWPSEAEKSESARRGALRPSGWRSDTALRPHGRTAPS